MLTVINRVERARSIVIVKHKYMLMCNHKIRINIMRCLRNSTVRREIGLLLELAGQGGTGLGGVWKRGRPLLWHVSYELIFFFGWVGGGGFPGRMIKGTLQLGCPNFPRGSLFTYGRQSIFSTMGYSFPRGQWEGWWWFSV